MIDIIIVNLDVGFYQRMTPEKALANVEKEKKDLYFQACLELRRTLNPVFYSTDGIPGADALAAQKRLAALLNYKLKREYSETCGFIQARMLLAIVRSNSLLLCGPHDKGACIWKWSDLTDGAVMALIAPWRGTGKMSRDKVRDTGQGTSGSRRIARNILESAYIWGTDRRGKTEEVGIGGVA